MSDSIYREDVLAFLRKWHEVKDYSYGEKNIIGAAIQEVENLPPPCPSWIPCSERLPEKERPYLVTTRQGSIEVALFRPTSDLKGGRLYWRYANCYPINEYTVAWLSSPLPKPYKPKE